MGTPDASTYDALLEPLLGRAEGLVVGLDFDGTLAPIVEDPAQAHIHPDAPQVLLDLADRVRAVAVITGRPARQVLALGGLDEVGASFGERGLDLRVLGQYGNERWSSHQRRVISPAPPRGLARFLGDLHGHLTSAGEPDAWVEEKGLAVGVHTRRLPDPQAAFDRLLPVLRERAEALGLVVEPGKYVVEVRAPGMDKGVAVRRLAEEVGATGVVFAGDDLGDVEAFNAVRELRDDGLDGLLVLSSSAEQRRIPALAELADVEVDGPDGVLDLLRGLVDSIDRTRSRA